jgi:hypothetical protein
MGLANISVKQTVVTDERDPAIGHNHEIPGSGGLPPMDLLCLPLGFGNQLRISGGKAGAYSRGAAFALWSTLSFHDVFSVSLD